MAIKPPAWAKNAVPTLKGWKHPKRNEILVNKKFTQEEIDEYLGKDVQVTVQEPVQEPLVEVQPEVSSDEQITISEPEAVVFETLPEENIEATTTVARKPPRRKSFNYKK